MCVCVMFIVICLHKFDVFKFVLFSHNLVDCFILKGQMLFLLIYVYIRSINVF